MAKQNLSDVCSDNHTVATFLVVD